MNNEEDKEKDIGDRLITSPDGSGLPGWGLEEEYVTSGFMATEEALKEALDNPGTLTTSQNMQEFAGPIKKEEEIKRVSHDFREFLESLPRKSKRRVFGRERTYTGRFEERLRIQRLEAIKKREQV